MNEPFITEASSLVTFPLRHKHLPGCLTAAAPLYRTQLSICESWNGSNRPVFCESVWMCVGATSFRVSSSSSPSLEEVWSPCSHTPPRVRANVFANLQTKTPALSLSGPVLPPPSHWTPGWCLTEPWMLFDCRTFPKRLAAAPFVAAEGRLLSWSFTPPAVAPDHCPPSSNRFIVRERVPNNGQ